MKRSLSLATALVLFSSIVTGCGSKESTPEFEYDESEHKVTYNGNDSIITLPDVKVIESVSCNNPEDISKIKLSQSTINFNIDTKSFSHLVEFEVDENNTEYTSFDGLIYTKYNKELTVEVPPKKIDISFPSNANVYLDRFREWQGTELTIPDNVKAVYYYHGLLDKEITLNIPDKILNSDDSRQIDSINEMIMDKKVILKNNGEIIDTPFEKSTEPSEEELQRLRNQTFKGDRTLFNLSLFDHSKKGADESRLDIQNIDAEIKNGNMVINISAKSKIELGRNYTVVIGYYNAAGERKGGFTCDLGYIAGLGSKEAEFNGVPNCIDYIKYYYVESIIDSKQ